MKRGLKYLGILAMAAVACLGTQGVFAHCQNPDDAYPVNQCGGFAVFAPPPVDAGPVNYQAWWQLGFGNANLMRSADTAATHANNGVGFVAGGTCTGGDGVAGPPDPGTCTIGGLIGKACSLGVDCNGFIGNDNGRRTNPDPGSGVDFNGMQSGSVIGGPPGSLCWGGATSWGAFGVDGCGDNARTGVTADLNGSGSPCNGLKDDNTLNKYYGACNGLGTSTLAYQIDAPMGTLLKEQSNKYFALGFFATRSRNQDPTSVLQGDFAVEAIGEGATNRGDANTLPPPAPPGRFNIIPWQPIPQPNVSAVLSIPADPNSPRNVNLTWTGVRLVDDGSTRPSTDATLGGATGVGTRDQGPLVRYQAERATIGSTVPGTCTGAPPNGVCTAGDPQMIGNPCSTNAVCGAVCGPFAAVGSPTGTTSLSLTGATAIPANSCLRLRSTFGKAPNTTALTLANCSNGRCGDLGYDVASRITVIGGQLVASNATLTVAAKNKNAVTFEWNTTGETDLTGFEVVGKDANGKVHTLASANCKECVTGRGATYTLVVPSGDVKGAKSAQIKSLPSGTLSNEVTIK
jgi:hypothetical protein